MKYLDALKALTESGLDNAQEIADAISGQVADAEAKYSESQNRLEGLKREGTISQAAQALGAKPEVLKLLLNGVTDPLEIKEGKPMLGSQDLKAWVETTHPAFLPSLFPVVDSIPQPPNLPSGSAAGNPPREEKPNAWSNHLRQYYRAVEKVLGVEAAASPQSSNLSRGTASGNPTREEKPNALTAHFQQYQQAVEKVLGVS